jgi:leucyl/phenylalanyl-tRNA--protein transferase
MFSTRKDMSKVALVYLVERLKAGGFSLFDTQFLTDHLASLGGVEIARDLFQKQLGQALRKSANFNALRVAQTKEEYSV